MGIFAYLALLAAVALAVALINLVPDSAIPPQFKRLAVIVGIVFPVLVALVAIGGLGGDVMIPRLR